MRARVNGDLQLEFTDVALTSYAGRELFGRYLRGTGFNAVIRTACAGLPSWGDFWAVAMVRLLIGLLVVGGRRLRHLAFVQDDPVFRRFDEVPVVPTARTMSRWLQQWLVTRAAGYAIKVPFSWICLTRVKRCNVLERVWRRASTEPPEHTPTGPGARRIRRHDASFRVARLLRACEEILQVIANLLARGSRPFYPACHERPSLS